MEQLGRADRAAGEFQHFSKAVDSLTAQSLKFGDTGSQRRCNARNASGAALSDSQERMLYWHAMAQGREAIAQEFLQACNSHSQELLEAANKIVCTVVDAFGIVAGSSPLPPSSHAEPLPQWPQSSEQRVLTPMKAHVSALTWPSLPVVAKSPAPEIPNTPEISMKTPGRPWTPEESHELVNSIMPSTKARFFHDFDVEALEDCANVFDGTSIDVMHGEKHQNHCSNVRVPLMAGHDEIDIDDKVFSEREQGTTAQPFRSAFPPHHKVMQACI
jgi:hypothetical protein